MARLIDAEALDKELETLMVRCQALQKKQAAQDYNFVITVLDSAPTVDAVEVVRCKDCRKGAVAVVHEQKVVRCPYLERCMDLEGFCCFGERRGQK